MTKRTRRCDAWRIDCDYEHKLGTYERLWHAQFEDEWVRGVFHKDVLDLHTTTEQRLEISRARHAAERDIVTANPVHVRASHARPVQRKCDRHRYYEQADYPSEYETRHGLKQDAVHASQDETELLAGAGGSIEDALIAAIDAKFSKPTTPNKKRAPRG